MEILEDNKNFEATSKTSIFCKNLVLIKEIITTVTVLCLTEQSGCRREEMLLGGVETIRGEEHRK